MRFSPLILLLVFLISACSSDLDFDQVDDAEVTQVFTLAAVYFDINQTNVVDTAGNEISSLPQVVSEFDIFSPKYIDENLVKLTYRINYKNTFERDFEMTFNFLDGSANPVTASKQFTATNQTENGEVIFEFVGTDLDALKNALQIGIGIELLGTTPAIDVSKEAVLSLNSSVTLKLEYKR